MAAEVHTQGLRLLLECLAGLETVPSSCWIGLATNDSLAENATLGDVTEVTGTGYARQQVASGGTGWPTSQGAGTNDWEVKTLQVTFTNSGTGNWATARTAFICTAQTGTQGKLIASFPLSQARTLGPGDSLKVTITLQLAG